MFGKSLLQKILAEQKYTNELLKIIIENFEQKEKFVKQQNNQEEPPSINERFSDWDKWKGQYK
ncbi:YebO family protein [Enterococcus durans]|uniref:YebO family protein n=1 Tax=Enterococcus durans TaxID=53345 RepID=UPI001FBBF806|nr:YebO family protein [Enterococcus durans]MCJ2171210.1 YebO family protein [Enterococcus durans]